MTKRSTNLITFANKMSMCLWMWFFFLLFISRIVRHILGTLWSIVFSVYVQKTWRYLDFTKKFSVRLGLWTSDNLEMTISVFIHWNMIEHCNHIYKTEDQAIDIQTNQKNTWTQQLINVSLDKIVFRAHLWHTFLMFFFLWKRIN